MTQTNKQILKLKSLKWKVPQDRNEREIEGWAFSEKELKEALYDNWEADEWAEGRYEKI